jgi:hypothetical protein
MEFLEKPLPLYVYGKKFHNAFRFSVTQYQDYSAVFHVE